MIVRESLVSEGSEDLQLGDARPVKVYVRVRPLDEREKAISGVGVVEVEEGGEFISVIDVRGNLGEEQVKDWFTEAKDEEQAIPVRGGFWGRQRTGRGMPESGEPSCGRSSQRRLCLHFRLRSHRDRKDPHVGEFHLGW